MNFKSRDGRWCKVFKFKVGFGGVKYKPLRWFGGVQGVTNSRLSVGTGLCS